MPSSHTCHGPRGRTPVAAGPSLCAVLGTAATAATPLAILVALLLLLLLAPLVVSSQIILYDMLYTPDATVEAQVNALREGFRSAFHARAWTLPSGTTVELHTKEDAGYTLNGSDVAGAFAAGWQAYPDMMAIIGPFEDTRVLTMAMHPTVQQNSIMMLAPFTGSTLSRRWSPNLYYTRAPPSAELYVLLQYLINTLKLRRVGYIDLTSPQFGTADYDTTVAELTAAGFDPPIVYRAAYAGPFDAEEFAKYASQRPQVTIAFALPGEHLGALVQAFFTTPETAGTVLMGPSGNQDVFYTVYARLAAAGALTPRDKQIFTSATNTLATQTEYKHILAFNTDMAKFITDGESKYSPGKPDEQPNIFVENPNIGELMVAGWIAGKLVYTALSDSDATVSRQAFQESLFNQKRWIIEGDFVLGDYGGSCEPLAAAQGAVCNCNQGGRTTYLKHLNSSLIFVPIPNETFKYSNSVCNTTNHRLPTPVSMTMVNFTDDSTLSGTFTALQNPLWYAIHTANAASSSFSMNIDIRQWHAATAQDELDAALADMRLDVTCGPVPRTRPLVGLLMVEPIYPRPYPNVFVRNYIVLTPTLQQQFFVLFAFLAGDFERPVSSTAARLITKGYESTETHNAPAASRAAGAAAAAPSRSAATVSATGTGDGATVFSSDAEAAATMKTAFEDSAETYRLDAPSYSNLGATQAVTDGFMDSGYNYAVGIDGSDATAIADYLAANPGAVCALSFQDFAMYYDQLVAAFQGQPADVQARLLTMTNLPLWTDDSGTGSSLLTSFKAAVPAEDHTPHGIQAWAGVNFMSGLLSITPNATVAELTTAVYRNGIVVADDLQFGQYVQCDEASLQSCQNTNYGARDIRGLSMQRVLDPVNTSDTYPSLTPSMIYTKREEKKGLSKGALIGIIVGSVVGGLLIIAAIVLLAVCCCRAGARDNKNAPKDGEEPVTLVFTDIESSTALWAAAPQVMPDAVAQHHKLIRSLIAKYKCYEVKTIGDSFMIACKDAYDGVRLAGEIQTKFLESDWETDELDAAYRSFELSKAEADEEYVPHSATLSQPVYEKLWNGLRVRVGIHTGLSDIRQDEVTKGFDYYGDTSNMAARTEAIANGGQVIMTESTWWALSNKERESLTSTDHGPQGLRGVPYAVEMYQLDVVPGRVFPPLRTEVDAILPDDGFGGGDADSTGPDALLSSIGTVTGPSAAIAAVLTSCFSPYPAARRVKELQPLMEKWGIPVPPRNRRISEDDYCQGLINRLAIKMSSIQSFKQKMAGFDPNATNNTATHSGAGGGGGGGAGEGAGGRRNTTRQSLPGSFFNRSGGNNPNSNNYYYNNYNASGNNNNNNNTNSNMNEDVQLDSNGLLSSHNIPGGGGGGDTNSATMAPFVGNSNNNNTTTNSPGKAVGGSGEEREEEQQQQQQQQKRQKPSSRSPQPTSQLNSENLAKLTEGQGLHYLREEPPQSQQQQQPQRRLGSAGLGNNNNNGGGGGGNNNNNPLAQSHSRPQTGNNNNNNDDPFGGTVFVPMPSDIGAQEL